MLFQVGDLKELVKRNFAGQAPRGGEQWPSHAEVPRSLPDGTDFRSFPPAGRPLSRGGIVLSMDPAIGEADGDVLIEEGPNRRGGAKPRRRRRGGDRRHQA